MRALLALAPLAILLLPGAGALGVASATLVVEADAPLLAPLVVARPLAAYDAERASGAIEERRAPEAPAVQAPEPVVDGTLETSLPDVRVEPPRVMKGTVHESRLSRVERLAAPIAPRAPLVPPRALDAAPAAGALPMSEAQRAPVISPAPAPAPLQPPAPSAQAAPEPAASPEPRAWPPAATAALAALLVPLALALYHRLQGPAVAESQTRRALLARLAQRPGATATELAREMGIDPSTALYHLRRLTRAGLAVAHGAPRASRYFVAGSHAPDERARLLAQRSRAHVLAAVRQAPGADKTGLARALDISRASVGWHLGFLERAKLVRLERVGRCVRVFPITF